MKMKKVWRNAAAALMAAALVGGTLPADIGGFDLTGTAIVANAEDGSVSFDEETGTLTLNGAITTEMLNGYKAKTLNIVAAPGTVFPEDCSFMFNNFYNVKTIDLSEADTSGVTNMYRMFGSCWFLKSIDLTGKFTTASVTDMSEMFYGCSALISLDLSNFDTGNVTKMDGMFYHVSELNELDLSSFNTKKVTDMQQMFRVCEGLEELNVSSFDTSNVTDMSIMFQDCKLLTSLDLSSFDTSNTTITNYMFENCYNLKTLIASEKWDTSSVTTDENMFRNCEKLVGEKGTVYDSNHITADYAQIDGGEENPGYLTSKNQTLADGKYKQTAKKGDTYYTRFVFVTPKTELAGKNKAKFTATYGGKDYTYETDKYYTGMTSNSIKYTAASADSVLLVVTVTSGSDISADLTCTLDFE